MPGTIKVDVWHVKHIIVAEQEEKGDGSGMDLIAQNWR